MEPENGPLEQEYTLASHSSCGLHVGWT